MFFRPKKELIIENQKMILEFDIGNGPEWAVATIQKSYEEELKIAAPLRRGTPILLPKGLEIKASLPREDALYWFDTIILDREAGRMPTFLLQGPGEVHRVQRREHKRVSTNLPVEVIIPSGDAALFRQRNSADISAGGVKIEGDSLPLGVSVHLKLDLPGGESPIFARGRVMRTNDDNSGKEPGYWFVIQFEDISSTDQENIVKYVFDESKEKPE